MQSEKVYLSLSARNRLGEMHPGDAVAVLRVLALLRDDSYRNRGKYDLCFNDEFNNKVTWGLMEGSVFVSFIELDDGRVMVSHCSFLSRFRPPYQPKWGETI